MEKTPQLPTELKDDLINRNIKYLENKIGNIEGNWDWENDETSDNKINKFIEEWCPENAPHLLDTDENEGQELREWVECETLKAELKGFQLGQQSSEQRILGIIEGFDETTRELDDNPFKEGVGFALEELKSLINSPKEQTARSIAPARKFSGILENSQMSNTADSSEPAKAFNLAETGSSNSICKYYCREHSLDRSNPLKENKGECMVFGCGKIAEFKFTQQKAEDGGR